MLSVKDNMVRRGLITNKAPLCVIG